MALTMTGTKKFASLLTTTLAIALTALVSGASVSAQINPATAMSAAKNGAQAANTSATQSQSTSATSKPSQTSATNPQNKMNTSATQPPAKQNTNPPAKDTKTPAQKQAKADTKAAAASAKTVPAKTAPAQKAPPAGDVSRTTKPVLPQGRRDPFITLVGKQTGGGGPAVNLPPGKGGLQVSTLILQGIVSGPNGMIAVVANPQKSVYFLHVGDELFDGRVDKIEIGSVIFHEVGKDAFGKPVEREVTRKLNPSSIGDQP
jgi:hypothetical protein